MGVKLDYLSIGDSLKCVRRCAELEKTCIAIFLKYDTFSALNITAIVSVPRVDIYGYVYSPQLENSQKFKLTLVMIPES